MFGKGEDISIDGQTHSGVRTVKSRRRLSKQHGKGLAAPEFVPESSMVLRQLRFKDGGVNPVDT